MKPKTLKLLRHMKKDIKESANINLGPSKETFSFLKTLLELYWNTEDVDDKIITIEELKEALKHKEWNITW
jgi:hypothetical protein